MVEVHGAIATLLCRNHKTPVADAAVSSVDMSASVAHTAVITGAGNGIGRALSLGLAAADTGPRGGYRRISGDGHR